MAWFHKYRYAEVIDGSYSKLERQALPIVSFEIRQSGNGPESVAAVKCIISEKPAIRRWFRRDQVILYAGRTDFATAIEKKNNRPLLQRIFKGLNFIGRNPLS